MTRIEKETIVGALRLYAEAQAHRAQTASDPQQRAIAIREKTTARGLAYVFNSILDEPAGSVRI